MLPEAAKTNKRSVEPAPESALETEIPREFVRLEAKIKFLSSSIEELITKLTPVLGNPAPSTVENKDIVEPTTEIATRLRSASIAIETVNGQISILAERCEL